MLEVFGSLFDTTAATVIAPWSFLVCVGVSLAIGGFLALVSSFRSRHSSSFLLTLGLIPAVVCVIIMMVNGNIGAGVAVAGAFSLVRFRSASGTAKEIGMIFLAMGAGLLTGMGYLAYAGLFALILGAAVFFVNLTGITFRRKETLRRTMHITIPEDLNYTEVFDDLLKQYTTESQVVSVKTTNMGSLFKLTYHLTLKDPAKEKQFIDDLRVRNGNLEINLARQEALENAL